MPEEVAIVTESEDNVSVVTCDILMSDQLFVELQLIWGATSIDKSQHDTTDLMHSLISVTP